MGDGLVRRATEEMDLSGAIWRKSSYGGEDGGASIEIAFLPGSKEGSDHVIAMRDGNDPEGPALIFTPDEWRAFTAGVNDGEFDLAQGLPEVLGPAVDHPDAAGMVAEQPGPVRNRSR